MPANENELENIRANLTAALLAVNRERSEKERLAARCRQLESWLLSASLEQFDGAHLLEVACAWASDAYRIAWKSKITGFGSHGAATFSYKVAKAQCEYMDKEFPELSHWPEAV